MPESGGTADDRSLPFSVALKIVVLIALGLSAARVGPLSLVRGSVLAWRRTIFSIGGEKSAGHGEIFAGGDPEDQSRRIHLGTF
jgi:hypothetical protein